MRALVILLLTLSAVTVGQVSAPVANGAVPQPNEILRNDRVTVSLLELAPGQSMPTHRHQRDAVAVSITDGKIQDKVSGEKPTTEKLSAGEVRLHAAGLTHSVTNEGPGPFRTVVVEFADAQGKVKKLGNTT